MCLIQIGSGSASLDTNIQDGFSNYIVSKNIKKKVLIVEANSIHINNLKKFYKENINDGGKLVIEDTCTSYLPRFGNPNKYSFINFSKQIINQINYIFPFSVKKKFKNEISKYVYGLSFYESMVEFKINRK